MENLPLSETLRKRLMRYSILGTTTACVAVALAGVLPLHQRLSIQHETQLLSHVGGYRNTLEEYLNRISDITVQITSRSVIRNRLEAYNRGEIDRATLIKDTGPKLQDALTQSSLLRGIIRLDHRGEPVVVLGRTELNTLPLLPANQVRIDGPVYANGVLSLVVSAPIINNQREQVGTDIGIFDVAIIEELLNSVGTSGASLFIAQANGEKIQFPFQPGALTVSPPLSGAYLSAKQEPKALVKAFLPDHLAAATTVSNTDWVLFGLYDENVVAAPLRRGLLTIGAVILVLSGLSALAMYLMLRPLAGKLVLHQHDLESTVKKQTAEIQERKTVLDAIIKHAADGILSTDRRGIIDQFNTSAERIFGYRAEEVIGKNVSILVHPLYANQHDNYIAEYLRSGEARFIAKGPRVFPAMRKDGTPFTLELAISEVYVDGQRKFTGIFRDITERVQAEQALQREKMEQQQLLERLKETQTQLLQSEKLASIGQLAAGVAHEINNPVGYISANIYSLEKYLAEIFDLLNMYEESENLIANADAKEAIERKRKSVDLTFVKEDIRSLLSETVEGISRVRQIVQDLKDFSHSDSGEWQWANLHKGLDSTLNIVYSELKYKADIVKEYGAVPDVQCLPSQLNQVFMNLLVNAAHAMEERGTITLRTGTDNTYAWVEIEDTGCGIPEHHLTKIFDPFFTTKPVGKGTGLGLSLSYGIVEKHHGRIDVQSKVGQGTRFRVWIPIEQNAAASHGAEHDPKRANTIEPLDAVVSTR